VDLSRAAFEDLENDVINRGWAFERHNGIVTRDGYILQLWRVPGKLSEPAEKVQDKNPVILVHGMGSSGATWFAN